MTKVLNPYPILISMNALIVDFNDSFTYNLAALFDSLSFNHVVKSFDEISLDTIKSANYDCVVWGPGPGHPREYHKVSSIIEELFKEKKILQVGVCLGHQLLLQSLGFKIIEAPIKKHGRRGDFQIPSWKCFEKEHQGKLFQVQYYSSLAVTGPSPGDVKCVEDDGVIISSMGEGHVSFQFHPESVGTSCPEAFFIGLPNSLI